MWAHVSVSASQEAHPIPRPCLFFQVGAGARGRERAPLFRWCRRPGTVDRQEPPARADSDGLFDSTVNHLDDPDVFVIYHDAQARHGPF
jgi:hypothetical protein